MDEDAERGVIFTLGVALGLRVMWLLFAARGRRAAHQVFEAAGDLAEQAGGLLDLGEAQPARARTS